MHTSICFYCIGMCLLNTIATADTYKILLHVSTYGKSHMMFFKRMGNVLSAAGHECVYYAPAYSLEGEAYNVEKESSCRVIRASAANLTVWAEIMQRRREAEKMSGLAAIIHQSGVIQQWPHFVKNACKAEVTNTSLIAELKAEKFDVIIGHPIGFCPLVMKAVLGVKGFIWTSPAVMFESMGDLVGCPTPPSYVTGFMSSFSDRMNYAERAFNFIGVVMGQTLGYRLSVKPYNDMARELFGDHFPSVDQLASESTLVFVNSEEFLDFPRPILHKIVYIGGLGMHFEGAVLNERWRAVADAATGGLVVFSFGTMSTSETWPDDWHSALLNSFARFPNVTFVMKMDNGYRLPDNYTNIVVTKWMPQTALLAHPNARAFITHGGYNSMLEVANIGVPMITVPLSVDQFRNSKAAARQGISIYLDKATLSESALTDALRTLLNGDRHRQAARTLATMLKRKPMKPNEALIKWTEFVAEFQELPHLHVVGSELGFIQYFLLDIIATVSLAALTLCFLVYKFCKCCCHSLCSRGKSVLE